MYIPSSFAIQDLSSLHHFIAQNSFGILISQVDDTPFATHIPFLVDCEAGPNGTLLGHVAKANPHWRHLTQQPGFAIFHGPHAYISPTWYQAENTVPTWNYMAVHVYGKITLIEEELPLIDILQKTVGVYEKNMPAPWSFDATSDFNKKLAAQVVGFRFEIRKIEGKFKLNQNHPVERRERVINALESHESENDHAIAAAMRQSLIG